MVTPLRSSGAPIVTPETRADALNRARTLFIAAHRTDARFDHVTTTSMLEQVVAIASVPKTGRDGCTLAGKILDALTDREWEVWVEPYDRLLSLRPLPPLKPDIPEVARRADGRYYDGMRRKWVLPGEEPPGIFGGPSVPETSAGDPDETDSPQPA